MKISMDNASRIFSKTIKRNALIELVRKKMVDIGKATEEMNNDCRKMVGAMLGLIEEFPGKLLFMIPVEGGLVSVLQKGLSRRSAIAISVQYSFRRIGQRV